MKETKDRLILAFEATSDAIWDWDVPTGRLYYSPHYFRSLGYSPEESPRNTEEFEALLHPDDLEVVRARLDQVLRREKDLYKIEYRFRTKAGGWRWALSRGKIIEWDRDEGPIRMLGTLVDIHDRKEAEAGLLRAHDELEQRVRDQTASLTESEKQLRLLSSHLLKAQEKERRRISAELHDELGQCLTVLKLMIRSIEMKLGQDQQAVRRECESVRSHVDRVIADVRRLSHDLSPELLEGLGLTAAIRRMVQDFGRHSGIRVSLRLGDVERLFSEESKIIVYRVVQEALTNIGRHANADRLRVALEERRGSVFLRVEDNGIGFDSGTLEQESDGQRRMGLTTMKQRIGMLGGKLRVESRASRGTRITANISLDRAEP